MSKSLNGKVQTVLGLIDSDQLGVTSMHEHLIIDFTVVFQKPEDLIAVSYTHLTLPTSDLV